MLLRGKARNFPVWSAPPVLEADIKHNFFQNFDNQWSRANLQTRLEWTGKLTDRRREVHGKLKGFDNDGGVEIQVPVLNRLNAHAFAGDEGDRRNGATISKLLAAV